MSLRSNGFKSPMNTRTKKKHIDPCGRCVFFDSDCWILPHGLLQDRSNCEGPCIVAEARPVEDFPHSVGEMSRSDKGGRARQA